MKFKKLFLVSVAILLISLLAAVPAAAQGVFVKHPGPPDPPHPVLEATGDEEVVGGACVIYDGSAGPYPYKMWYTAIKNENDQTVVSICYAESTNGTDWIRPYATPVLEGGDEDWEKHGVGAPSVFIDSMGDYRMWYTGLNGLTASIGYASSTDGIDWDKRPGGAAVLTGTLPWDADSVAFPSVIYDSSVDEYKMWYTGQDTSQGSGSFLYEVAIGYAYSDDGLDWHKASDPVLTKTPGSWDDRGVGACSVVKAGTRFTMYYTGFEDSGPVAEIGEATCYDGIGLAWTKTGAPVLEAGGDWDSSGVAAPSVVYMGGATKMWFTGAGYAPTGAGDAPLFPIMAIGYAEELPEPVPASSNLSTGLMIGGFAVLMIVAYFGVRRFQLQGR